MVVCSFAACDLSTLPVIGSFFVKTATVEFNVVDGELVGEAPASYSDNAALELPKASLQYYAFKGWSLNADLSGDLFTEIPAHYALTEDQIANGIVFYAVYERLSGTIAYDLAGGEWVDAEGPASYLYGEVIELPEVEKEHFEFVAWTIDGEKVNGIVESQEGNVTLVATWVQVETEISFVLNKDGAALPSAGDVFDTEAGVDLSKDKYIPTVDGAYFAGWYLDADLTEAVTKIDAGTTEAVILYAKWAETPVVGGDNWVPAN
jgi:uncharacterized repeat protein (TIGR02543 family)